MSKSCLSNKVTKMLLTGATGLSERRARGRRLNWNAEAVSNLGYRFPQIDICRCRSDFSRVAFDWTIMTDEIHGESNRHPALSGRSLLHLNAPTHVPPPTQPAVPAPSSHRRVSARVLQATLRVFGGLRCVGDLEAHVSWRGPHAGLDS